jgi:hypothetical protein
MSYALRLGVVMLLLLSARFVRAGIFDGSFSGTRTNTAAVTLESDGSITDRTDLIGQSRPATLEFTANGGGFDVKINASLAGVTTLDNRTTESLMSGSDISWTQIYSSNGIDAIQADWIGTISPFDGSVALQINGTVTSKLLVDTVNGTDFDTLTATSGPFSVHQASESTAVPLPAAAWSALTVLIPLIVLKVNGLRSIAR